MVVRVEKVDKGRRSEFDRGDLLPLPKGGSHFPRSTEYSRFVG